MSARVSTEALLLNACKEIEYLRALIVRWVNAPSGNARFEAGQDLYQAAEAIGKQVGQ